MPSRTQRCQNAGGRGKEGGGEFRTSIEMGELVLLKEGELRGFALCINRNLSIK